MAIDVRRLAVEALTRVQQESSYSSAVLDSILNKYGDEIPQPDQALLSRLYYGVLERLLTLDYIIETHSKIKLKKMHPVVVQILRLGCYQLIFMDKIPAPAAVFESVKLAKKMNQERASGFINAVLRSVDRDRGSLFDSLPGGIQGLSIRTSCPEELLKMWEKSYGMEYAEKIALSANQPPPVTIRVNTLKLTTEEFEDILDKAGIPYSRHSFLPACYNIDDIYRLKRVAEIPKNCYYHQDAASQICCKALDPRPGERIADVCSAPGGKSITSAQYMGNKGEILAFDIHPFKRDIIEERTKSMGVSIVRADVRDASSPCPDELAEKFDRVLCDVPCSGLGVIRRKPEIRYKPLESFAGLPGLQYEILHQSSRMVRPGGVLQYSTCTLNVEENEGVVERFLNEHPEFSPRILPLKECFNRSGTKPSHQITLFPHLFDTDGFYIASFVKK